MKIKIERSGGISGISSSSEINAGNLPPTLEQTVRDLLNNKETHLTGMKRPKGAADDINYKITIENGINNRIINCSELQMSGNIKSLISYIEKNPPKKSK